MVSENLIKAYFYKNLAMDLQRFLKRQMKMLRGIEWDREALLRRMGLGRKPARTAMGGVTLFVLGGVAGAIAGLALAPKSGEELRTQFKHRARKMIEQRRVQPPVEAPAQA